MNRRKTFLLIVIIQILCGVKVFAQVSLKGLDLDGDVEKWFQQVTRNTPPPYLQGTQYNITDQNAREHKFYKKLTWATGNLIFGGREIKDVQLLYNSCDDELITLNFGMLTSGVYAILLNQSRIDEFTIYDTRFVNILNTPTPPPGPGFYELYYNGKQLDVFVKHSKKMNVTISGITYKKYSKNFLYMEGRYYRLINTRSILKVFPNQKDEIKHFIRSNKIKLNVRNREGLKEVIQYCDQILEQA